MLRERREKEGSKVEIKCFYNTGIVWGRTAKDCYYLNIKIRNLQHFEKINKTCNCLSTGPAWVLLSYFLSFEIKLINRVKTGGQKERFMMEIPSACVVPRHYWFIQFMLS